MKHTPLGKPVEVSPGVAQVTFSTRVRSIAPQFIRARVELAGFYDTLGRRITPPRIVAQGVEGGWITWEARHLGDDEPDTCFGYGE